MTDTVAVVGGTGALGFGVAARLAKAGVPVVIGSRQAERAMEAAERLHRLVPHAQVSAAQNETAVTEASRLVVLAVPLNSQIATAKSISPGLTERHIVMDATVPLAPAVGGRPTQIVGLWAGSAAEQLMAHLPSSVRVVSGLHTLSAALLEDLDSPLAQSTLICGDRLADKEYVTSVLETIEGLQVVDAGKLEMSRLVESITPVLIGINRRYTTHAGVSITGLTSSLAHT
ncbi:NADPH-dependent F420 reductase [Rhodococcus opacus]|uniref:NADPH-dependent F420 reductase n=1 Tax=Rhodococcus opacus TaxID=37919 RepID=A0AAX3YUT5_RHOOP|nr:NADPH-dependent F420 reductase [Rhodococcus opacus]MCZ4590200.1 NADPH-dependent F420 reductase [Rhodococcus opacus]WLF52305.1 NADPH-dependent F420 reductase [Rhodococcus opacus]